MKEVRSMTHEEEGQLRIHIKDYWTFFILSVILIPSMLFIFFLIDRNLKSLITSLVMGGCFILFNFLVCWREAKNSRKDLENKSVEVVYGTITKSEPSFTHAYNIEIDGKDTIKFHNICYPVFRKGDTIEITKAPASKRILRILVNGNLIYKLEKFGISFKEANKMTMEQ